MAVSTATVNVTQGGSSSGQYRAGWSRTAPWTLVRFIRGLLRVGAGGSRHRLSAVGRGPAGTAGVPASPVRVGSRSDRAQRGPSHPHGWYRVHRRSPRPAVLTSGRTTGTDPRRRHATPPT